MVSRTFISIYYSAVLISLFIHTFIGSQPTKQKLSRKRKSRSSAVDRNKCQVCGGRFVPGEENEWAGCDVCPRWYHQRCVTATLDGNWECSYHDDK